MTAAERQMRVVHGGALTTVQDRGRDGWRHLGVAVAGALDAAQAALANRMVGNPESAAVLELTLRGPSLEFAHPIRIALCGADIEANHEAPGSRRCAVPCGRPVALPAGRLTLGVIQTGLRAWLAIAGGIDVPRVLGSRSTDLRGGFGGFDGRELRAGDVLALGEHPVIEATAVAAPSWWVALDDRATANDPIRYIPTDAPWARALAERAWTVDARSNRQGLRCAGDAIVARSPERISAPVAPGTIQLPPDGHPIVLLADAQTVGGYPRLGYAISADLPRLAQWRPGDALRFVAVDASAASAASRRRRDATTRALWAIDRAMSPPRTP